jgi:hypothetical protein
MNVQAESADDPERSHDGHLVGAYSPVWLSGPSHYEGLVATCSFGDDDQARADDGNESGTT